LGKHSRNRKAIHSYGHGLTCVESVSVIHWL
jgi:hypothetical protein